MLGKTRYVEIQVRKSPYSRGWEPVQIRLVVKVSSLTKFADMHRVSSMRIDVALPPCATTVGLDFIALYIRFCRGEDKRG